jgi:hypothetical protein
MGFTPMLCRLLLALCHGSLLLAASLAWAAEPLTPTETIRLLPKNGLGKLETWLQETGRDDPEQVFTVKDGVLRISGEGSGYVATPESYQDYHLTVEYKWGEGRSNKSKYVRNSGVLLHAIGEHGSAGAWMTSLEVQLAQGCEGDLIVIRGQGDDGRPYPATITCNTRVESDHRTRWDPQGKETVYSGKQFWWNKHDPAYEELLDTRGRWDVASRLGDWTKVECICRGDRVTIKINDVVVNECYNVQPAAGRILLQNEGYEVFFRNWTLAPLAKQE